MFNNLTALGYGIVVFAIIIGVGTVVLYNFGGAVVQCSADKTWNASGGVCSNATGSAAGSGTAYTNINYLNGYMGQSGLAGWTPAVIAISVGLLFLGAFAVGNGRKGKY